MISINEPSILLTGGSGFLGREIKKTLIRHNIITLGQNNAEIICDLANHIPDLIGDINTVIHAAGKAHSIPNTELAKQLFFDVNVRGTQNLLKALEKRSGLKAFVFISSVAVYGKVDGNLINENSPLTARDPYGLSKIQAEEIVQNWCATQKVTCVILRLPLVAGTNPPGNLNTMIKGIFKGYYFDIANGEARKSIVLAEDVAKIVPKATEVGGIYNLTDGYHPSFSELSELMAKQIGKRKPANIPHWLAYLMAKSGDLIGSRAPINSDKLRKITSDLTFDDSKARRLLGWDPTPVLDGFKIH